jgi:hypothetical protein
MEDDEKILKKIIAKEVNECEDAELLDLIYKLLIKSKQE